MSPVIAHQVKVSALLLRRTEYGDSDLVLQVITDSLGRISVMARAARASKRRFAGGIEPFHGLEFHLDQPTRGDLYRLRDTRLAQPRLGLVGNLAALGVAGRALSWVRAVTIASTPEPQIFRACTQLLDELDQHPDLTTTRGEAVLALFGLTLLNALGWGLELERCVRCAMPCPPDSTSTIEPRQGGIVCRRCGGGRHRVSANLRQRMLQAANLEPPDLPAVDSSIMLDIVEETLLAHPGIESA